MDTLPRTLDSYSRWLVQRVGVASGLPRYSITIEVPCPRCQPSVADGLAEYLNEFGDLSQTLWRAFDPPLVNDLAEYRFAQQLLGQPDSYLRAIASLGGSIIEGNGVARQLSGLRHCFQVCLACWEPDDDVPFHLHLNQKRFEQGRVVPVIADSFLEWVQGGGDPARDAQSSARDTESIARA